MKKVIVICAFFLLQCLIANKCFGTVYKIFSDNGEYRAEIVLKTANYMGLYGQTKIYDNNNNKFLYKINRGFLDEVYLSNNGKAILYVSQTQDSITHFLNGQINKQYCISSLLNCDKRNDYCSFYYRNWDIRLPYDSSIHNKHDYLRKQYQWEIDTSILKHRAYLYKEKADSDLILADKYPMFSFDDTLYIITPELKLFRFSISTGELFVEDYLKSVNSIKNKVNYKYQESEDLNIKYRQFPYLKNGKPIIDSLTSQFGYKFKRGDKALDDDSLKYYSFKIVGFIYQNNKFKVVENTLDSLIDKQDLINFFESQEYEDLKIPDFIDEWYFYDDFYFRNKDINKAKQDRFFYDSLAKETRKQNEKADSLKGIYIPKDLNECNEYFESLLLPIDIKFIDRFDSLSDFIYYNNIRNFHFGFGETIREKWNLWHGSRLTVFFNKYGVFEPSDMSSFILESYFCKKNKIEYNFEERLKMYNEKNKKLFYYR